MKNALKIFKKEIKEVIKNRSIWFPILVVSIIFCIGFPLFLILTVDSMIKEPGTINFIQKFFPTSTNIAVSMIGFIIKQFIIFLLLIPAMIPSLIAPTTIVLEKDSNTLEPLLATPIKTQELLLGKTLSAMIPAFVVSTIDFIMITIVVDIISYIKLGVTPLPTLEWVIAAFILSPVLSFIITIVSIMVSSRTTDIRSAQGIGSVIIFPIYAIIGLQIGGIFMLNFRYLLIACLVLILICPLLLRLAIKLFDRENILTRWKMK
jgi:ABC-2 type transport system permease protein